MAGKRRQREHEHGARRDRLQRPADIPTTASQGIVPLDASGTSPLTSPSASATNPPPGRAPSHRTLADATVPTAAPATREPPTREPPTQRLTTAAESDADTDSPPTAYATIRVEQALTATEEGSAHALAPQRTATSPAILIRGASKPPRLTAHIVPRRTGPRSAVAQFISSMVVVIAFASAVALASPLGSAAGLTHTFQAYANAIPFIPTPTPTPRPAPVPQGGQPAHSADPGKQAIINEITAVFGSYAQGALNVARCESGYDPNAWNPYAIGNSHASGVFQILYPSTWNGTSYASSSPFNADANIHAAYEMFKRDGYSWREWACQP